MITAVIAAMLLGIQTEGLSPSMCSAPWGQRSSPAYHLQLVREASVIVRARALDSVWASQVSAVDTVAWQWAGGKVQFRVLEVLKGDSVSGELQIYGHLTRRDEFNPHRVPPYRAGRPSVLRGACFTYEYKQGGEYLLVLAAARGDLTPYWAPIAPVNEQLRGPHDHWLTWVRAALRT